MTATVRRLALTLALVAVIGLGVVVRRGEVAGVVAGVGLLAAAAIAAGALTHRAAPVTLGILALGGLVLLGEQDGRWSLLWVVAAGVVLVALAEVAIPGARGHAETAWDPEVAAARRRFVVGATIAGLLGALVVGAAATTDTKGGLLFVAGCVAAVGAAALTGMMLRDALQGVAPSRPSAPQRPPGSTRGTGTGAAGPT